MPETTQAKPSRWTVVAKKTKKVFKRILSIIIFFLVVFIYFKYFFTYSEGSRPGLLQKFSYKGIIFKTYEGELILSSISSNSNVTLASEKFLFSVPNKKLAHQFFDLQGLSVIVYYKEKKGVVFWRGDSRYLVDSIKVRN